MDDKTKQAFKLIYNGNMNEVKKLIENEKTINYKIPDEHNKTLLDYTIQSNNNEILEIMIKNNIVIDSIDNKGKNILYGPIKHFNNKIVETIIKYQNNILISQDNNNFYPFHYAIKYNNLPALELLNKHLKYSSKNKFYENIKDNNDNSLFHYVILNNLENAIKIFDILKVETIEDNVNYDNVSLLMDLIKLIGMNKNNKNILDYVNEKIIYINFNIQDKDNDKFLFEYLLDNGLSNYIVFYIEKYKKLIEKPNDKLNINFNIQDKKCQTIIHLLLRDIFKNPENGLKDIEILNYLFDNKFIVNYNIYDLKLKYPINLFLKILHYYKHLNKKERIKRNFDIYDNLIIYGKKLIMKSNLNFQDLNYNSSVHLLIKYNFYQLFKNELVNKKINITLLNNENKTPLDFLKDKKQDFINIFIESYENYLKNHKFIQSQFNNDCLKNIEKCKKEIKNKILVNDLKDFNITKNNINIKNIKTDKDILFNNNIYLGSSLDIICGCKYLLTKYNNIYFPYNKKINKNTQLTITQYFKFNDINYDNEVIFEDNFIYWYPEKLDLYVNPYIIDKINKKKEKKDFIFIPLLIFNTKFNINHMNILYFIKNKIYHYDPYGLFYNTEFKFDKLAEKINIEFKNYFDYINPRLYLKKAGIQLFEESDKSLIYFNDASGYCIVWCILFSQILFENKNLSFDKIIKYIIINFYQNKVNLKVVIKNYLNDIINLRNELLKKYKIDINQYYNENITEDIYFNIMNNLKYPIGKDKIQIELKDFS